MAELGSPITASGTSAVDETGPDGADVSISLKTSNELTLVNDGPNSVCYYLNNKGAFVAGGGTDPGTGNKCFLVKSGESITEKQELLKSVFLICTTGETASVRYKADNKQFSI